jgi:hypothetical protein
MANDGRWEMGMLNFIQERILYLTSKDRALCDPER